MLQCDTAFICTERFLFAAESPRWLSLIGATQIPKKIGRKESETVVDLVLEVIQVFAPLLHFLAVCTAVVVLVKHSLANVGSVADHLVRHIVVETVRDTSAADRVGTHT